MNLRRAEEKDWARLLVWRNDPATAAASFTEKAVGLDEHMAWLRKTIERTPEGVMRLYVATNPNGTTVGTGRIEIERKRKDVSAVLSLAVDAQHRGKGYAAEIIERLVAAARDEFPGARVVAYVKPSNSTSLRAFATAGFLPTSIGADRVELECRR